jgi:hypothetical protein
MPEVLDLLTKTGPYGITAVVYILMDRQLKKLDSDLEEERKERRDAQAVVNRFAGDLPLLTKAIDDLTGEVEGGRGTNG